MMKNFFKSWKETLHINGKSYGADYIDTFKDGGELSFYLFHNDVNEEEASVIVTAPLSTTYTIVRKVQ